MCNMDYMYINYSIMSVCILNIDLNILDDIKLFIQLKKKLIDVDGFRVDKNLFS